MSKTMKTDEKIYEILEHYAKLTREKDREVIAVVLYGSQNYNLDTAESDIDAYAIVNPSRHGIMRAETERTGTIHTDTGNITVKDVRAYINTLMGMGMNYLETLYTPYIYICDERYREDMDAIRAHADDIVASNPNRMCKALMGIAFNASKIADHEMQRNGLEGNRKAMKMLARTMHAVTALHSVLQGIPFRTAIDAKSSSRYEVMRKLKEGTYENDFAIIPEMLAQEIAMLKDRIDEHFPMNEKNNANDMRCAMEDIGIRILMKSESLSNATARTNAIDDNEDQTRAWLAQLQDDIAKDHIDGHASNAPVYYAISDVMEQVVPKGYHDNVQYYERRECRHMTREELMEELERYNVLPDLLCNEVMALEQQGGKCVYTVTDEDAFEKQLDAWDIDTIYMADIGIIKPDTLFLTKEDAQNHLDANAHHYTQAARVCDMVAWRSPRFETFLRLFQNIDFEQSTIVLKTDDASR